MPSKGVHEFNVISKSKQRISVFNSNSYAGGTITRAGTLNSPGANQISAGSTLGNSDVATLPSGGRILVCNTVGEWATEIDKIERNDKVVRSGGRANPFDFDIEMAAADYDDIKYMHSWYTDALDQSRYTRGENITGVKATAYRAVMREYMPHIQDENDIMKATALDTWVSSEKLPDYAMDSNDEAVVTYSCSASGIYYETGRVFGIFADGNGQDGGLG